MQTVPVKNFKIGLNQPLTLICGPCVIESETHTLKIAENLKEIFRNLQINLIFKASYDKANRSSFNAFRGPGLKKGLKILQKVAQELDLAVTTDVHSVEEAKIVGENLDCVQIPAFLCRQTDLISAAALTKAVIFVKKGQFMAPWDMKNVVEKIKACNNHKIILIERGVSFGYNNLVCDMRSIPIMQKLQVPVCFDATHAVQLPGGKGFESSGEREFIPHLAKAAIAAGANCLFMEVHPEPKMAASDASTVFPLDQLKDLLVTLEKLYQIIQA